MDFNKDPYGKENNFHAHTIRDELHIELTYPDLPGNKIQYLVFDQESVRASDGIRISYDYDRDGYKIEQASVFEWSADDEICDPQWKEVAFIRAWGLERGGEEVR